MSVSATVPAWPDMQYGAWSPTKRTLHLISQIFGKVRLALSPHQPNFLFTALFVTPRGYSTGPIPDGQRIFEMDLDVFREHITLRASDGTSREIAFTRLAAIASIYDAVLSALRELGVQLSISPIPQEIPDLTPLDRDDRAPAWVPEHAKAWLTTIAATHGVFDRWRAHFFGRSAIALWWGAFDYSLMLFSGTKADPPPNRGYLLKYDLDSELMNAGFYAGDDAHEAFYYGYVYPQPARCQELPMPQGVRWSEEFREWVLPYQSVRQSGDPARMLTEFLDGLYGACCDAAGWNRSMHAYAAPPLRRAPDGQQR